MNLSEIDRLPQVFFDWAATVGHRQRRNPENYDRFQNAAAAFRALMGEIESEMATGRTRYSEVEREVARAKREKHLAEERVNRELMIKLQCEIYRDYGIT